MIKIVKKFLHTIESCYLCIRFPFLYPRNRFTGRHHVSPNWLLRLTNKYHKKAYTNISLGYRFYKDPKDCIETNTVIEHVGKYDFKVSLISNSILKFESRYIESPIEFNLQKHVGNGFIITGITTSVNSFTGNPFIIYHIHKNEVVNDNYGFSFKTFDICVSRYNEKIYNFIRYVWDNIIDRICFIPSRTELDAMPDGWRKAFGIQMCKEIKQELKKYNYLYKYRITQIKEKFGSLKMYDNGSPNGCVYKIIDKYEAISYHTCINCGSPAKYISKGWISPYCENCISNHDDYNLIHE